MNLNIPAIKRAMRTKGVSQADIAGMLSVSREAVSKWLQGTAVPRPGRVLKLSRVLDLAFDEIFALSVSEEPQIAFRKAGAARTTGVHLTRAKDMGFLLRSLVKYLPFDTLSYPAAFIDPRPDIAYVRQATADIRARMGLSSEVVDFPDIIGFFEEVHAVLVPVMWGKKQLHENALHIYLPDSRTTWVYLNLDSKILDFKFWMAHELAHVKAPNLDQSQGEEFADLFAAELLFPVSVAERYLESLRSIGSDGVTINKIQEIASQFVISPVTVLAQLNSAASARKEAGIDLNVHPSTANFNKRFPDVNEIIFGTENPAAPNYIRQCDETFRTPFYRALGAFLRESSKSWSFIQRILNIGPLDAKDLYRALTDDAAKDPS